MDSKSRGRSAAGLGIAAAVLFVAGPILATTGIARPLVGFGLFALGGLVGLVAALGGIVALARGGRRNGVTALATGGLVLAILVALAAPSLGYPRINDITTDVDDPPALTHASSLAENAGRDLSYPAPFGEIVRSAYPDLKPLRANAAPSVAYERALAVAKDMPDWEITREDREDGTFEAVATSTLFRFRDDVVVRVRSDGDGSRIDVRSKSRDGQGDMGANAARIRTYLAKLDAGWPADAG